MLKRAIVAVIAVISITGCSGTMNTKEFLGNKPEFVLEEYFSGKTKAWGMFHDRFGKLRREFVVDITGNWDGQLLTLDEEFKYSDGEEDRRIWKIKKIKDNSYIGNAGDIIGQASGKSAGNALNWTYDMNLKVGNQVWKVSFDDWMFLQPGGVLLNRASISKWGFEIGVVTISFSKTYTELENFSDFSFQKHAAE